jgi:hypothetical protein
MAAGLILSVQTGAGAGSANETSITGIDLISADNATNTLSNRQAYPITVGTNSYEKWVRLKLATAPSNYVRSFKIWSDGSFDSSTTFAFTGSYITYQQGTTSVSTIATGNFASFTAGGTKAVWDDATYTATNAYTRYVVFQLQVAASAQPGNWTQETISYSYDEA